MRIVNIHTRVISASAQQIEPLLLSLGSAQDRVWPHEDWPPMLLDRPLQTGAAGGHGPIRYRVSVYEPAKRVRFDFQRSSQGFHEITLQNQGARCLLTHTINTRPTLKFFLAWHLSIRFMHDALIEDLFDKLQSQFEPLSQRSTWGHYLKFLRARAGWHTQPRLLVSQQKAI